MPIPREDLVPEIPIPRKKIGPEMPVPLGTDKHMLQLYLSATTLAGGNNRKFLLNLLDCSATAADRLE